MCFTRRVKHARRILVRGVVAGCLLGIQPAGAGQETFDGTGLSNSWVDGGSFTGRSGVVWTYANARGYPTVYSNDASITLRTGNTATKGWLRSQTLTGGVGTVSAAFKQELTGAVDCDIRAGDVLIGNYVSAGTLGVVEVAAFEAVDPATRRPVTNDFVLVLSNRLASAGAVAVDDLTWTPFRLFVRLDRTGTNTAYAGEEFDAFAEVFDIGQPVTGGWTIEPAFAGTATDTNSLHWTLIPDHADIGRIFTLTYAAAGSETNHSARFQMEVVEAPNPRFVDFEGASFGYDTNSGVVTNLNGLNWLFLNARTSDSTDRKLGAVSARFRHTTALPATMESLDSFPDGIGTVSLHYAHYGSNRVVTFELQVHGDGEDWMTVPNGTFSVEGHEDITNSVFSVDVQRQGETWLRLLTTGNANEIANIDDLRIREYGNVLPRLTWSGETAAPLGRETVLDFTLLNAEAIARTWLYSLLPENANAVFEVTPADQLQFRFSPQDTNEWGEYTVSASASIGGEGAAGTSLVIQVVSAPAFELTPAATNLTVPDIVDVWVTNVVLHGTNTEWTTEWVAQPLFGNPGSVSNKSRFRIAAGTLESDAGDHVLTAWLTDLGTGVTASNIVVLSVTGGGGDITNEVYPILSFGLTNVVVSGRVGRVFTAFGTTNLAEGVGEPNWTWEGSARTNTDGADMNLEVPAAPDPRLFFYGIRVRAAP